MARRLFPVVKRNPARFEVLYHPSLNTFNQFDSEFGGLEGVILEEHVRIANSFEDAEQAAQERLSTAKTSKLRLRRGDEIDELVLQAAGSKTVEHGYPLSTLIASFRGNRFRVEMGGPPGGVHEPYRVLNELRPEGFTVEACATCLSFRFSGTARDMSAGSKGYCTHSSEKKRARSLPPIVSVSHLCPKYKFVADEERQYPYIKVNRQQPNIQE